MGAAAKTVIELLGGAHCEGRGFFTMKWTAGGIVRACFPERYVTLYHINNIYAAEQILNE